MGIHSVGVKDQAPPRNSFFISEGFAYISPDEPIFLHIYGLYAKITDIPELIDCVLANTDLLQLVATTPAGIVDSPISAPLEIYGPDATSL